VGFWKAPSSRHQQLRSNDHPWSDRAEILQGGSEHVNLHCERWRLDLEQSAVIFYSVNSNSVLGEIIL
jgi:hypothetical protein